MKYICLGYLDEKKWEAMSKGERNALMDECFAYDDVLRKNGHFIGGEALQSARNATTVRWKNDKVSITDGPYAETKEHLGGILETLEQFRNLPPDFAPKVLKDPYDKFAPDPKQWPALVAKVKKMGLEFKGFAREEMKSIKAHVLVTLSDRDGVRPEHAVEMFRLIPQAQLAVFPGADHFLLWQDPEKMLPTIAAFFDAPMPGAR